MVSIIEKIIYVVLPLAAYITAGSLKFMINFIKSKKNAFNQIGLGGFPSTHTSIISSSLFANLFCLDVSLIAIALSASITLIVIIDAIDLRNRIGLIAAAVNKLYDNTGNDRKNFKLLREKNGHSIYEIWGGLLIGLCSAYFAFLVSNYFIRLLS